MARCPMCGSPTVSPVRYVAWGGLLAPRLYRLVRCGWCGCRFSARSGWPEGDLVRAYSRGVLLVLSAIAVGVGALVWWACA